MNDQRNDPLMRAPSAPALWRRLWPLAILIAGLVAFFVFGLDDFVSFESLSAHRDDLMAAVNRSYVAAALAYILVYAVAVAFSLPVGAILSLVGGFLFGWLAGTIYILIGATVGATILFVIARTAVGDLLRARAAGFVSRLEQGFRKDAFNYLLFLRLVPVFPFWAVNLVPAFLGVDIKTFVIATFIGIIPGAAIYASVGNGLDEVIAAGGGPELGIVLRPAVLVPLLGLAVLSLVPVLYKKMSAARAGKKG